MPSPAAPPSLLAGLTLCCSPLSSGLAHGWAPLGSAAGLGKLQLLVTAKGTSLTHMPPLQIYSKSTTDLLEMPSVPTLEIK